MAEKLGYMKLAVDDDVDLLNLSSDQKQGSCKRKTNHKRRTNGCKLCLSIFFLLVGIAMVLTGSWLVFSYVRSYYSLQDDVQPVNSIEIIEIIESPQEPGFADSLLNILSDDKCTIPSSDKMDCFPGGGASKDACQKKGCCWVPVDRRNNFPLGDQSRSPMLTDTPWCFYPEDPTAGYKFDKITPTATGVRAQYSRSDKTHWPKDVMTVVMDTFEETDNRFHFKIYDPANSRFEVPIETPKVSKKTSSKNYAVDVNQQNFGLKVSRVPQKPGSSVLFNTGSFKLTFSDQFIEITTVLPSNYVYGLGEHRDSFLHDANKGFTLSTWARDIPPAGCVNCNLYGQHPFLLGLDASGNAYGIFLLNSNAMEISGSPPKESQADGSQAINGPTLTYRTIGGILDFYVFLGPTPSDVVQQYLEVIGRPYMPPYWGLGYHLCRWGYHSTDNMKAVIKRMRDGGFPYDTQWNDIDYMDNHFDWTYDKSKFSDLPAVVKDLHDNGQHYIMIVDPGIRNQSGYPVYDEGLRDGAFILKEKSDDPIIGVVWPGQTAFPDFFSSAAKKWWARWAKNYHDQVPFDGLWTDMNEPSNFGTGSVDGCGDGPLDNPPFTPGIVGGDLKQKTLCPSARHHNGVHYDLHSMYGHSEVIASHDAMMELRPGKRTIIISRSTFPSSGRYGGHWTGDNDSSWDDLMYSIPGILNFQLFGIPFVGADICGFMGTSNAELCVRWTQLGAFYPFMRNHNVDNSPDQDPGADMFSVDEKAAIKKALTLRYTLLPYLYTLLYRAHTNGTTVARPLLFEYPNDTNTYDNDKQFMWGESLMVVPVLKQGATSVDGYFPNDTWVDFFDGSVVSSGVHTIQAPVDSIPVYLRAGGIIPTQQPDVTTAKSRKNPFMLLVVLDSEEKACGTLYWDDGDTLNATENGLFNHLSFSVTEKGKLVSSVDHNGYSSEPMMLNRVTLYNVAGDLKSASVNGKSVTLTKPDQTYAITDFAADMLTSITVEWQ